MLQDPWFWLVTVLAVPLYWLLPTAQRSTFLALVSCAYLAWLTPFGTLALAAWTLAFYFVVNLSPQRSERAPLLLSVAIIGWLAVFKYVPPLAATWFEGSALASIALPLGISYYSFKLIHYAVEAGRRALPAHRLGDFASYMFLVPIFTAGPIERFDHYLNEREAEWHGDSTVIGLTRVARGLVKKFVFSPALLLFLPVAGPGEFVAFPLWEGLSATQAWIHLALAYLVLYVDFSAYSDIAIGLSRLYGLKIMENFNLPVMARNPPDFWRRWHISLSSWCLEYVYMPSLGLFRRPLVSNLLAFLVMGLWHSASSNRVAWACYHVAGVTVYNTWARFKRRRKIRLLPAPVGNVVALLATQAFVVAGAAFLVGTEQRSLTDSLRLLLALAGIST